MPDCRCRRHRRSTTAELRCLIVVIIIHSNVCATAAARAHNILCNTLPIYIITPIIPEFGVRAQPSRAKPSCRTVRQGACARCAHGRLFVPKPCRKPLLPPPPPQRPLISIQHSRMYVKYCCSAARGPQHLCHYCWYLLKVYHTVNQCFVAAMLCRPAAAPTGGAWGALRMTFV